MSVTENVRRAASERPRPGRRIRRNEKTALNGAVAFGLLAEKNKKGGAQEQFWQQHSLGEQRFWNISRCV